jgi:hypothetical protein
MAGNRNVCRVTLCSIKLIVDQDSHGKTAQRHGITKPSFRIASLLVLKSSMVKSRNLPPL